MEALVRFLFEKTGHKVAEGALSSTQGDASQEIRLSLNGEDIQKFSELETKLLRAVRGLLSAAASAQSTRVHLEVTEI